MPLRKDIWGAGGIRKQEGEGPHYYLFSPLGDGPVPLDIIVIGPLWLRLLGPTQRPSHRVRCLFWPPHIH